MSSAAQEEATVAAAATASSNSNGYHPPEAASEGRPASPIKQSSSLSSPERRPASPVKPDDRPRSRMSRAEQLLLDLDAEIERDRRHQRGGSASVSPSPPPHPPKQALGGSENGGSSSKGGSRVDVRTVSRALEEDAAAHSATAQRNQPELQHQQLLPDQQRLQRRVDDLLEENRRLQASLSRATAAATAGGDSNGTTADGASADRPRLDSDESQRLLDRLLFEKETMATEMQQLRLQVESLQLQKQQPSAQPQQQHPGLPEFDPDSPAALKRRIIDLEQQIADLHEANETMRQSSAGGQSPQQQQQKQQQQIGNNLPSWSPASDSRLRATVEELTVENRVLRNEVTRLRQKERPDMSYLRDEVGGLRTEMDALSERNNLLMQENRRLQAGTHGTDSSLSSFHHRALYYDGVGGSLGDSASRASLSQPHRGLDSGFRAVSIADVSSSRQQQQQPRPQFEARSYQRYEQPFELTASATLDRHSRSRSPAKQDSAQTLKKRHPIVPPLSLSGAADPVGGNGTAAAAPADDSGESTDTILTDVEREFEGLDAGKAGYRSKYTQDFSSSAAVGSRDRPRRQSSQLHGGSRHARSSSSLAVYRSTGKALERRPPSPPLSPPLTPPSPPTRRQQPQQPEGGVVSPFSTLGRHPFAPKRHNDIRTGDLVKFTRQGGRISKGLVHYIGRLPGRNDVYLGVELDHEEGKHDGVYDGRRYFQCKSRKGVFVAFNKLIMCYQSK
uniref:CAP-Gly domain-containing protein n=1 Tax=Macrostomum lignano TaxID=282301 RepID=A0A1I8GS16_9PLAT